MYDAVAPSYDEHYDRQLDRVEDEVLYGQLPQFHAASILDVACGTGRLLDFIDPLIYVGIDASRGMIEEARRKYGAHRRTFINTEAERLSQVVAPAAFDLACTFWSFSYFHDPQAVLEGMHHALRRHGHVLIHAYAPRYSKRPSYILDDCAFNTFTPEEIGLMLRNAGFRNVRAFPFRVLGDRLIWRLPAQALSRLLTWEMANLPANWGMTYMLAGMK